jgi:ABC-type branched-subunit amino acid transport system ATPase component
VNLAATGHGILLVEQRVALASRVAAQVTVLVDGKVHYAASGDEFRALPDVGAIFFGSEASPDGEAIRSA